jgi:Predicted integral membrane protein
MSRFPVNYFVSLWRPSKLFERRYIYKWWQLLFLFFFINGCLMVPATFQLMKMKTIPFSILAPDLSQHVDPGIVSQLAGHSIVNGRLLAQSAVSIKGQTITAIDLENKWPATGPNNHVKIRGFGNALVMHQDHLIISDRNGFGFRIDYPRGTTMTFNGSWENLSRRVSELWVRQYQNLFFGMLSLLEFSGMMIASLLVMGTTALILWMTRLTKMSDIHSFREAVAIVLMAAGIPTLATLIVSLISFDFGLMTMIESCGIVLMITFVFGTTHFQDTRRNTENRLAEHSGR